MPQEMNSEDAQALPGHVASTVGLGGMWAAWKASRAAQRGIAERREIAKAWNDRYCYRVMLDDKAERLTGTAMCGLPPRGGNRWMCPDCNYIHAPTECSVWSGLQYPACCTTGAGNRLSHGVRVS